MYIEDVFDIAPHAPPETVLWLAVIERAIMDYCWATSDLSIKHRNNLQWFFFHTESEPHNLRYICNDIFDYPDAAESILKRLHELKNSTVMEKDFIRSMRYRGYY